MEESARSCQIISVMGIKGGVGATTIAVNLAVSLAKNNNSKSVALLDMNIAGDIPFFLELEPLYSWEEITRNITRLDSIFLKSIMTVDGSGVSILPSPDYLDSKSMATPNTIESLLTVMQQMFDFIVLDIGQLLNDTAFKILNMSDRNIMIVLQSLPHLAKINKLMRMFKKLGYPDTNNIHIVVNRFMKNTNIDIPDMEHSLEKKIFWTIPNDCKTAITAINKGLPLKKIAPNKEISRSFMQLAFCINGNTEEGEEKRKRWIFF